MPIKARANKCSLKRRGERVVCSANSSSVKNRIISEYKQMQHNPQMRGELQVCRGIDKTGLLLRPACWMFIT